MKTFTDNIKSILGMIIVLMTYAIFIICLFKFKDDINVVSQIIIAVVGGFGVATGYYFGYSQGSSKKDDTIATLSNNPVVTNSDTTIIQAEKK